MEPWPFPDLHWTNQQQDSELSPDFEIVEFPDGLSSIFAVGESDEDEASVAAGEVHHDAELEDGAHPLEDRNQLGLGHVPRNFADEDLAALRWQRPRPVTRRPEKIVFADQESN